MYKGLTAEKGNRKMKFTVQKSVFMSKLTPAMGTVSNKNTITSIEGVLLETMED
jgi:DNA polymerase III sliding clamp (beta) subunit (PCNA family)